MERGLTSTRPWAYNRSDFQRDRSCLDRCTKVETQCQKQRYIYMHISASTIGNAHCIQLTHLVSTDCSTPIFCVTLIYNKTSLTRKLRRGDYVLQEFETEVRQRFKASNTSLSTSPVPDLMVVLTDALFLWRHDFAGSHWSLQKFVGPFIEKGWAKRIRGLIQCQSAF